MLLIIYIPFRKKNMSDLSTQNAKELADLDYNKLKRHNHIRWGEKWTRQDCSTIRNAGEVWRQKKLLQL